MIRGLLILLIGFVLGAGLMLVWWPRVPAGVSAPSSSDVRVFVSDAYLARRVESQAAGTGIVSIQNVRITSNPPADLIARVDLSVGPLSAPASLELMPIIQNGQVQTRLVTSEVGSIPIPPELAGFVVNAISSRIADPLRGGRVTGVKISPAGMEIFGTFS